MKHFSQQKSTGEKVTSEAEDAIHCISGLIYQVLRPGTGNERPGQDDVVQVLYQARTDTGNLLASSDENGTLRTFRVREAVPGLAEAFQLMTVGQKMRVWIPPHLASEKSQEAKERTLRFDIEMVSFSRVKESPVLPRELTSPRKEE